MNICDFSSVATLINDAIAESEKISQTAFFETLFGSFFKKKFADGGYDASLICRWMNGTAKISSQIPQYYVKLNKIDKLSDDINNEIIPMFYDKHKIKEDVYKLLIYDTTISKEKRDDLAKGYPYNTDTEIADFFARVILFGMERPFVKRDAKTKETLSLGILSPIVKDYIYDGIVPKPCKHFCGRNNELEQLHSMLKKKEKIFIQGVAGIGKSEFVKKYAQVYKNEYTNILYFNYSEDLKRMITDCDFADDTLNECDKKRFQRHNRFLRSLKEDTLIIVDNFNTIASDEPMLDVVMKYHCNIIFTTRSIFNNEECFELKEFETPEMLLELVRYFYKDALNEAETINEIITEVHSHTLSVELVARLLSTGILTPKRLLEELKRSNGVLHAEDKINVKKDGTSSKRTYYEHIHMLISLFMLSAEQNSIMRNMTMIPYEGIDPRLFAEWMGFTNLNSVNELIEYGFIQCNDHRRITLHPLIQEIAIDDTNPSVTSCAQLLNKLRELCLLHGLDLSYHLLMFKIIENTIKIIDKDDINSYLIFLKDTFPYMEKYAYRAGMEKVITELDKIVKKYNYGAAEKAMLLDYKAAFEHRCNKNYKRALQYEQQAVKYSTEIETVNPHLASNIYGNIGGLYQSVNQLEKAKDYMERGYFLIREYELEYTNDSVIQVCNYANLTADMGEPKKAIAMLETCAKAVKIYNSDDSSDYANLLWNISCIYMQMSNHPNAFKNFKAAMRIYAVVWADEPELMQSKINELKNIMAAHGLSPKNLIE